MKIISKEFYDLMQNFERDYKYYPLARESKDNFLRMAYYQNGETNKLFKAYMTGYSLAKSMAISDDLILDNK